MLFIIALLVCSIIGGLLAEAENTYASHPPKFYYTLALGLFFVSISLYIGGLVMVLK